MESDAHFTSVCTRSLQRQHCLLVQLLSCPTAVSPTQHIAPTSPTAGTQLQLLVHQERGRRLVPDEQQTLCKAPHLPSVSFPCYLSTTWVTRAAVPTQHPAYYTLTCSAESIQESWSANYGTSPGTFIYYGPNPGNMDTSNVLLSLKGGNVSKTEP